MGDPQRSIAPAGIGPTKTERDQLATGIWGAVQYPTAYEASQSSHFFPIGYLNVTEARWREIEALLHSPHQTN